tara:strand:+ start:187 stop:465 length:279 start_codon:yes stop_codon:yes gene_type:complete
MVNGKMIKCMEKELINIQVVLFIEVIGNVEKRKEMYLFYYNRVYMNFKMVQYMMVNGASIKCMVKDALLIKKEINGKENLSMEFINQKFKNN